MKGLKSLFLAIGFPPDTGGIQTVLYEIATRLQGENTVLARWVPGSEEFDAKQKISIIRSKQSKFQRLFYGALGRINQFKSLYYEYRKKFEEIISGKKIDVIQCGHITTGLLGYYAKKKYGVPYVIYTYGQEVMPPYVTKKNSFTWNAYKKILDNADIVYTPSHFTEEALLTLMEKCGNIRVIPMGSTDTERFKPKPKNKALLSRLNLEGKKIVLTVTRLEVYKGIDVVLEAFPKVLDKIPNARYLIVGSGEDRSRLDSLVQKFNLEDAVIFADHVSNFEMVDYYNLCDVFILNSRDCRNKSNVCPVGGRVEGFGVVFLEAGACEKPVIGGRSGGVVEAVSDGKTGLLVNPLDSNDVARAIVTLLTDKNYALKLGKNGRKKALEKYNFDNAARIIDGDLKKLVGKK